MNKNRVNKNRVGSVTALALCLLGALTQTAKAQQFVGMTCMGPTYIAPNGAPVLVTQEGLYLAKTITNYGPVVFSAVSRTDVVVTPYGVAGPVVPMPNGMPAILTSQGYYPLGIYRVQPPFPSGTGQPMPEFNRPPAVAPTQAPITPPQAPGQSGTGGSGSGGGGINWRQVIQTGIQLIPTIISLFGL